MKAADESKDQGRERLVPGKNFSEFQWGKALSAPLWICLILVTLIAAVYWPLGRSGFIQCDDPDYVYQNPQVQAGLTWTGVVWAFGSDHAGNWHPITWLSHMLDCQLFGLRPGAHHLVNLFFHAADTLLLFLLLRRLTQALWRSAFVAALFALHPLHVESVAWVSERKDVLSAFFFLLTLWAYARYAQSTELGVARSGKGNPALSYSLALLCFALGLMSKPMLVTLPFLLCLLDLWPLRRLEIRISRWGPDRNLGPGWQRLLMEKVPFFLLAAASSIVTFIAQTHAGAVMSAQVVPLELRVENALLSYALYLEKMVLPINLAFSYPYPDAIAPEMVVVAVGVLAGISYLALSQARRRPYLALGWLWYLGMLVPVIGLVQVGNQSMADRYTYLPLIGIFIVVTWWAAEVVSQWRLPATGSAVIATGVISLCGVLSAMQVRWWRDSETFFRHTLALTENNALAHLNLGTALAQEGKTAEAGEHFAEALRLAPSYAEAESNLGFTLAARGNYAAAIPLYRAALAVKPSLRGTHFLLANALNSQGDPAAAIPEYEAAVALAPDNDAALNDLAWLRAAVADPQLRNGTQAVELAERACRLTGFHEAQYLGTLAAAYAEAGRFGEAVGMAEKAQAQAVTAGQPELAERNRQLLDQYRAGKAYHEKPPQPLTPGL